MKICWAWCSHMCNKQSQLATTSWKKNVGRIPWPNRRVEMHRAKNVTETQNAERQKPWGQYQVPPVLYRMWWILEITWSNVRHHSDIQLSLQDSHLFSKLLSIWFSMTTMLAPSSSETLLLFLQNSTKTRSTTICSFPNKLCKALTILSWGCIHEALLSWDVS